MFKKKTNLFRILWIMIVLSLCLQIASLSAETGFVFSDIEITETSDEISLEALDEVTASPIPEASPSPTPEPTVTPKMYGRTNASGVNVRAKASADSQKVASFPNTGSFFEITGEETVGGATWYVVLLDSGDQGYIRGDLVEHTDEATYLAAIAEAQLKSQSGNSSSTNTKKSSAQSTKVPVAPSNSGGSSAIVNTSSGGSVWIPTNGGTKYHSRSGCSSMIDPQYVSVEEAQRLGFTACQRCY